MSLFWANTWNYFIRSHVNLPINLILNRKFKAYTVFWGLLNNWHFCMLGHPLYLKWVMVSFITYQRREKMCEVTWIYGGSVINGADTSKTQSWELFYSLASQGRKKLKGTLYFFSGLSDGSFSNHRSLLRFHQNLKMICFSQRSAPLSLCSGKLCVKWI